MRRLIVGVLFTLAAAAIPFSPACAMHASAGPELTVRASLDVLADVIDPSSQLASEGCTARKEAIVSSVEAHRTTPVAGQAQLDTAIAHCSVIRQAFDRIRALHSQAVSLINQGNLTEAQARLRDVRAAWRGLGVDPAPAAGGGGT